MSDFQEDPQDPSLEPTREKLLAALHIDDSQILREPDLFKWHGKKYDLRHAIPEEQAALFLKYLGENLWDEETPLNPLQLSFLQELTYFLSRIDRSIKLIGPAKISPIAYRLAREQVSLATLLNNAETLNVTFGNVINHTTRSKAGKSQSNWQQFVHALTFLHEELFQGQVERLATLLVCINQIHIYKYGSPRIS